MLTSENTAPLFVTLQPDWSDKVNLTVSFSTALFTTSSGKEQRTRQRFDGRPRIEYQNNGLSKLEWEARLKAIRAEMRAVCIVPFWTEGIQGAKSDRPVGRRCAPEGRRLAAPVAIRRRCGRYVYELAEYARPEWFTPGGWVYLWDGTQGQFRELAGNIDELPARRRASWHHMREAAEFTHRKARPGAHLLVLRPPTAGAAVLADSVTFYPCKRCRRISAQEEGRRQSQHSFDESLIYEAL